MSIEEKYIGESSLIQKPKKGLSFLIKEGAVKTPMLEDESVTLQKLDKDIQDDLKNIQNYLEGIQSEIANAPLKLEVSSSIGEMLAWGESATLTMRVTKASENVTSNVVKWVIERDTDNPNEDAAWNTSNSNRIIPYGDYATVNIHYKETANDLGEASVFSSFRITAIMSSGQRKTVVASV